MLEALGSPGASFVTLTYAEEHLPNGGTLVPRHLQLWLKRIRKTGGRFRFFGVGEYGDESFRPHYHVALFGVGAEDENLLATAWPRGFVHIGQLNWKTANYIAGYVNKKMTRWDDDRIQERGVHPEFARMSLRPGIGAHAVAQIARSLAQALPASLPDVPGQFRVEGRKAGYGRYLLKRLRKELGRDEKEPEVASWLRAQEVRGLLISLTPDGKSISVGAEALKEIERQKMREMEIRAKIWETHRRRKGL